MRETLNVKKQKAALSLIIFSLFAGILSLKSPKSYSVVQTHLGGGTVDAVEGKLPYKLSNPIWSFEATTRYHIDLRPVRLSHVVHNSLGTRIEEWQGVSDVKEIKPARLPETLCILSSQNPEIVWIKVRTGEKDEFVLRPGRASCLAVLLREVSKNGENATRRRYGIPDTIDLRKPWKLLAEQGIGANVPDFASLFRQIQTKPVQASHPAWHFGPNFLVNDLPSGFGWPRLMFDLHVFSPETIRLDGGRFQSRGQEVISDISCKRYFCEDSRSRRDIWVEPRSKLILREDVTVKSVHFPGTRRPPTRECKTGYQVLSFRFISSPSPSSFVLPTGAIIELPHLLEDLSLPKTVKRRRMTGLEAQVGFPLQPYPSGSSRASSE
jgi:hypothetical protein